MDAVLPRTLISLLVYAFIAAGCGGTIWSSAIKRPDHAVIRANAPLEYSLNDDFELKDRGRASLYLGDTIDVPAYRLAILSSGQVVPFFLLSDSTESPLMLAGDDASAISFEHISAFPLTFKVVATSSETSWARAIDFIARNCDVKVQTISQAVIETYSPNSITCNHCIGAAIARIIGSDSTTFTVRAYTNHSEEMPFAEHFAHRLAYFMATGEDS